MTHETRAANWIGKRCSFNTEPRGASVGGTVLVGIIDAARYIGKTERGSIPNYSLTIRGASGKTAEVNLVEQYAQISE